MHGMPMSDSSTQSNIDWRKANATQIALGLQSLRSKTLAVFDAHVAADRLTVPYANELNPPLWELGHLAWFQEYWIGRNQQRELGIHYDAKHTRLPSLLAETDSWYDSGAVAHATRWNLPLLAPETCKGYLAKTLNQTFDLLARADDSDDALYFYRLVLFHEAMHLEAAIYMAQVLGVDVSNHFAINSIATQAINTPFKCQFSHIKQVMRLGHQDSGFAFDNELGAHLVEVDAFEIDSRCVNWGEYLNFAETTARSLPRYVRRNESTYEKQEFGAWKPLKLHDTAVHVSLVEAQDYCDWAGRRLPTEAEWELAATLSDTSSKPGKFHWGDVWEWTSSTFAPYPGFVAHPYQDYSEPWFGTRQVLRGACSATQPMMKNAKYRNYFTPDRTDIYAGFRTCGL
jgi:gamma-glutamyl hercynylcysteine S-oxide synthase